MLKELLFVYAVGFALIYLVGPRLMEHLDEKIGGNDGPPSEPHELAAEDVKLVVELIVLIGGVDGHVVEAVLGEHHTMETVVLAEPAGSGAGGHEEGAPVRVEIGLLARTQHVPRREDAGIALLP